MDNMILTLGIFYLFLPSFPVNILSHGVTPENFETKTRSVYKKREVFSKNEKCLQKTRSVYKKREVLKTRSVFKKREVFSKNEKCFQKTRSVYKKREVLKTRSVYKKREVCVMDTSGAIAQNIRICASEF